MPMIDEIMGPAAFNEIMGPAAFNEIMGPAAGLTQSSGRPGGRGWA
jgi:hypothetical protein